MTLIRSLPVVAVAWFLLVGEGVRSSAWWLIAGAVVFAALVLLAALLQWRFCFFYFDDQQDFRLDSGVLYRTQRRVALSRLQSVDIVRPLVARVLGMASVRVEVAGSSDAGIVVQYLPVAQAESLRAEILSRAAGVDAATPIAPEFTLHRLPHGTLAASLLLRGSTVLAVLIVVVGVAGLLALAPATSLVVGLGVFVPLLNVWREFSAFINFTATRSADGVRLTSGLLRTTAQTVPPGRVHALELSQPLLWRRRDWVRVSMNLAGAGPATDDEQATVPRVLLPVATRTEALQLIGQLLPDWQLADRTFRPAPAAAKYRSWLQFRQLGVDMDDELLVVRRGRVVRRIGAVPHARVQSVRVVRGPWQRVLGLASMRADIVPGPVSILALHRDAAEARSLAEEEVGRMQQARATAAPERWRTDEPPPSAAPSRPPPIAWQISGAPNPEGT